jgi:hypothetical protein
VQAVLCINPCLFTVIRFYTGAFYLIFFLVHAQTHVGGGIGSIAYHF